MRTALPFAAFAVLAACGVEPAPGEPGEPPSTVPQSLQKAARPPLQPVQLADPFHTRWQKPVAPPGCAGAPALGYGFSDPAGDVTLSNADMLAVAATVADGMVDLRVQLCDLPFPPSNTHDFTWCLDTDASGATDACGVGSGADSFVQLNVGASGANVELGVGQDRHALAYPCTAVQYDVTTKVMRVLFPLAELPNVSRFDYDVGSVFGGSFGANDWAPSGQFGPMLAAQGTALPPFDGVSLCTLRP